MVIKGVMSSYTNAPNNERRGANEETTGCLDLGLKTQKISSLATVEKQTTKRSYGRIVIEMERERDWVYKETERWRKKLERN